MIPETLIGPAERTDLQEKTNADEMDRIFLIAELYQAVF